MADLSELEGLKIELKQVRPCFVVCLTPLVSYPHISIFNFQSVPTTVRRQVTKEALQLKRDGDLEGAKARVKSIRALKDRIEELEESQ